MGHENGLHISASIVEGPEAANNGSAQVETGIAPTGIPLQFKYEGMLWEVSARTFLKDKPDIPYRMIWTAEPTGDYGKRNFAMKPESWIQEQVGEQVPALAGVQK